MKKLTEEWKVKKQKTGNRSFRELIDFNFLNAENKEKTPVRKGVSKLKKNACSLSQWGLPLSIVEAYKSRNISKMFQWQYECLCMRDVLDGRNLVFSAPTSAGKTLVAEILMLKKEMFQNAGIVVDGYMGAHNPPGGFKAVDIAICTIEKANNLINRLMEEKRLNELGILIVDELHMLGDHSRGYLLELLLTKLLYNCKRNNIEVQIVGMSATLPNLRVLSTWLDSELYCTDFRPVPLLETFKIGAIVYDAKTKEPFRDLRKNTVIFSDDVDHITCLSIETITAGHGVLIFCPSKNWCENLATTIAKEIYTIGRPNAVPNGNPAYKIIGEKLREHLNGSQLNDIILQLKSSPAGLDSVLGLTVPFGVAFHHAGLTFDERDIIEGAFRQGILKILVATSTLSSGVNLPARRVIIRSPMFCGAVIDALSYKQMVGRAGRKGIDEKGESILLCKESEKNAALTLVNSELPPVKSCLLKSGSSSVHSSLKRALIEVIASGVASSQKEVQQYISCTLLYASIAAENEKFGNNVESSIEKCIEYLVDNDIIFKNEEPAKDSSEITYKPTRLGLAILASGFSPDDALRVLKELQLARRCFVLENDLHILYEVTPPYLSDQMGSLNWMHFLTLWEQLPDEYKRVGDLVGVQENFIGLGIQGKLNKNSHKFFQKLAVHQRFYATLALNDLIQEMPLSAVAEKYDCTRGILQSLQQTTSTFAGMLTVFCNRLGWYNLELLFSSFQKRVHFGIQQELCDLVRLSTLNAQRARALYNAGFETISSLASAAPDELALVLCNMGSFESAKQLDGDLAKEVLERSKAKRIRITGKQGVDEKEAANLIIAEAQNFIKQELGISKVSWKHLATKKFQGEMSSQSIHDTNVSKCSQDQSMSHQTIISPTHDDYPKIVRKIFDKEISENREHQTLISQNTPKTLSKSVNGGMINSQMLKSVRQNASLNLAQNAICSPNDSRENYVDVEETSKISKSGNTELLFKHTADCLNQSNHPSEIVSEKENLAIHSQNQSFPVDSEKIELPEENMINYSKLDDKRFDLGNSLDMVDDVHFSELLLSQTAETENVYFAESFISDFETANINLSGRFRPSDIKNNDTSMKECPLPSESKNSNESSSHDVLLNDSDIFKSDSIFSICLHNISGINQKNKENVSSDVDKIKQSIEKQLSNDKLIDDHILESSRLNSHNHSTPISNQKAEKIESNVINTANSLRITSSKNDDFAINESFDEISSHSKKELLVNETSGDIFFSDGSFNLDCLKESSNNDLCNEKLQCQKDDVKLDKETSGDIFDEDSFSDVKEMGVLDAVNPPIQNQITNATTNTVQPITVLPEKGVVSNLCTLNHTLNENNIGEPHIPSQIVKCKILEKCEKKSVSESVKKIYENKEHGLSAEKNKTKRIEEESNFWKSWDSSDNSLNLSNISQNAETLVKNTMSNKENVNMDNSENLTLDSADNSLFESFTSDVLPPTPVVNTTGKTPVSLRKVPNHSECVSFHDSNHDYFENEDLLTKGKQVSKLFNNQDKSAFRTSDVPDTELKEFFKKVAKMKRISFSVACEKTSLNHRSIGPPRSTKNSATKNEKCIVDQDIAVVGLAICYGEDAFYISISDQLITGKNFTPLPFHEKIRLIQDFFNIHLQCETLAAYDVKTQYKILWQGCGISLKQKCMDPSIAAWLLDPALGQQSLKLLSHSFYPEAVSLFQSFDNNRGSLGLQHFSSTPGKQRASTEAFVVFHLTNRLLSTLKEQQLYKAFTNIEMPSVTTLAKMEQNGLGFNTNLAVKYQKELQLKQQEILEKAYQMAGRRFNILSSKEVSRILYKELKLNPSIAPDSPSTRRQLAVGTPTHNRRLPPELKTNKECLEKILHLHPLPKAILDWRRLSFATTKYMYNEALQPRTRRQDSFFGMDRLYATCYIYTLTGRVNVHSPNLQFIPRDFNIDSVPQDVADSEENSEEDYHCTDEVMSQFGVSLRNLFIPSTGNVLLSADYSQLELRILAHLSGEKKLIKSLNSGMDVFKTIAANWKNIPIESVSGELRQQAKKICYGMIYGISANTLSQQLNTTKENASNFMETFKNSYPGLDAYFQSVIEKCSVNGYVSTLMHRRRYLPLIKSKIKSERAHAERQAINTTIQGSAADLIKAAMTKIEKNLLSAFPETLTPYSSIQNSNIPGSSVKKICRGGFLVLQMHDELIYEVNRDDLGVVVKIVKDAMEKTTKLSVKLPVNVRTGTSWGEMVELS
ncbi:unnamed protein product [Larinioides sclopetarius]|uniref:DNA polymerase theta n=1 Tax=Larinioides sclopetarius TaxID=280406 RepID=A0AAV1Z5F1_9ARAC